MGCDLSFTPSSRLINKEFTSQIGPPGMRNFTRNPRAFTANVDITGSLNIMAATL